MTQSIVSFSIEKTPSTGAPYLSTDKRVFDLEIGAGEDAYYLALMQDMLSLYGSPNKVMTADEVEKFRADLAALNAWSQLKYVDANGEVINPAGDTAVPPTYAPTYNVAEVPAVIDPVTHEVITPSIPAHYDPSLDFPEAPSAVLVTTMNRYMAEQLEKLNRMLRSFGYNADQYGTGYEGGLASALSQLQKVSAIDSGGTEVSQFYLAIGEAISAAQQANILYDSYTGSQSLQEILMSLYVSRGNELLYNEMSLLRDAIDNNQTALNYLNSLQDLMNQRDPEKFILNLVDISTSDPNSLVNLGTSLHEVTTAGDKAFNDYESKNYDASTNPVNPVSLFVQGTTIPIGTDTLEAYASSHDTSLFVRAFYDNLTTKGSTASDYTLQRLYDNLGIIITNVGGLSGEQADEATSLISTLKALQTDIKNLIDSGEGVQQWVQDIQSGQENDFQRHMSDAITASQSFNDTQREELSRVMFVFEEFYKSATSLLSTMTQIIEKMASYISR